MDLAHEYAYLLVTGDFSEAEFEARTHLKRGWFYPAGTQEGHWFYPQNTMVIRGHTTHQYVADSIQALIDQVSIFYPEEWLTKWRCCIHAVIYASGYQGGGFYWSADLIRQLAANSYQVQVYHHQVVQYGHDHAGGVWQPNTAFEPRVPNAQVYFSLYSSQYGAEQISQIMEMTPSQAVSRHDLITNTPRLAHLTHHPHTRWILESREASDQPLLAHLIDVLNQIEPCHRQIWQLHQDMDISMRLTATGHFPSQHVLIFDQALLKRLAALHLSLDFDHYFLGDDP